MRKVALATPGRADRNALAHMLGGVFHVTCASTYRTCHVRGEASLGNLTGDAAAWPCWVTSLPMSGAVLLQVGSSSKWELLSANVV